MHFYHLLRQLLQIQYKFRISGISVIVFRAKFSSVNPIAILDFNEQDMQ